MEKTKKDDIYNYKIENQYLKEELFLAKNAFYFAKNKIEELQNVLNNVSERINELEIEIANSIENQNSDYGENMCNSYYNSNTNSEQMKAISEPRSKKNIKNKRKYPDHEMYKCVIKSE